MKTKKIIYNIENLVSRIPSLFACLSYDEYGDCKLYSSSHFNNGSYGKIIENISIDNKLVANNSEIIPYIIYDINNNSYVYSYRTIMAYYYKYKKYKNYNNSSDYDLIKYVNDAIGYVYIDKSVFDEEQDLVPDGIYIANASSLLDNMLAIKSNSECCDNSKYYRMGGDLMVDNLKKLKIRANFLSILYKHQAEKSSQKLCIKANILLFSSDKDNGILETYNNNWIEGLKLQDDSKTNLKIGGEITLYNDKTYVCKNSHESVGIYNNDTKEITFNKNAFEEYPNNTNVRDKKYNNKNTFIGGNLSKKWNFINNIEYITGYCDSKLVSLRRFKNYLDGGDVQLKPSDGEDWLYFYRIGIIDYNTSNDSLGNILYFGDYYNNNINIKINDIVHNLYAYGSGLINIERIKEENKLIFTYVINAHLSAVYKGSKKDDMGNIYYFFDDFDFDFTSEYSKNNGVLYTDEYYYDNDSGINDIVDFNKYVTSDNITIDKYPFIINNLAKSTLVELNQTTIDNIYRLSSFKYPKNNEKDYLYMNTFKLEYLNGITYQPIVDNTVKINRGINSAFEKHIKLSEINTVEDMENYQNGGFFNIQKVN